MEYYGAVYDESSLTLREKTLVALATEDLLFSVLTV